MALGSGELGTVILGTEADSGGGITPVYLEHQAEFITQSALAAYTGQQGAFTTQAKLNAYQKRQAAFITQSYLHSRFTEWQCVFTTQSALSTHKTSQAVFVTQSNLQVYATHQSGFTTQSSLLAIAPYQVEFTTQAALAAVTKYYGYALNLTTGALSKLDNFKFDSLSGNMGTDENGIYTLTGILNDGAPIPAFIQTGRMDFKYSQLKRLMDFFVDMEGGPLTVSITTESGTLSYDLRKVDQLKTVKAILAKGHRGRFWQFKIANVAGSDSSFSAFEVVVEAASRRV